MPDQHVAVVAGSGSPTWMGGAHDVCLTLQMRQLAEVTRSKSESILLVLTLAAEGSRRQDGRARTDWSRRWRGLRVQRATHEGWGRSPPSPQHLGLKKSSGIAPGIEKSSSTLELRFHSKGSFSLEMLEIKAWRGETKAGPARTGPETHGTADPSIRR